MSKLISEEDKLKADQKSAQEKAETENKSTEKAKAALDALGVSSINAEVEPKKESKPMSNLDMLREQQSINERINYQAAKVKGQTFVRGK